VKWLFAFFFLWPLFKPTPLAAEPELYGIDVAHYLLGSELDYSFHVLPLGPYDPPRDLELFVVRDAYVKAASEFVRL
jgi:hypothetical protein